MSAKAIDVNNQTLNSLDYDIFSLIDGVLYLGLYTDANDGSSADKRPVELDYGEYFIFEDADSNSEIVDANITELEGTWTSICDNSMGNGKSYQGSIDVSGNEMTLNGQFYNDSYCTIPDTDLGLMQTSIASFTIGMSITTGSGLAAKKIDLHVQEMYGEINIHTEYNIFRISEGKLYFGDTSGVYDVSSNATRPVDLDFEEYLTKS